MAKMPPKSPGKTPMPKDPAKMPERGQRTETNKRMRGDTQHPGSHDAWEKLGS